MRRRMYIPDAVRDAIRDHVAAALDRAASEFDIRGEDEDTLTGHMGALLQVARQRVEVPPPDELPGVWQWAIKYTKFRGRGPGATERSSGADGIFELTLEIGGRTERKSLLFQAKVGARGGRDLVEQALKLSTWREAAVVIAYAPTGFTAFTLDEVLASRGGTPRGLGETTLRFPRVSLSRVRGGRRRTVL